MTELEKTKYAEIGSRIRIARTEQKLSQSELAEKAGVSSTHISEIEANVGSFLLLVPSPLFIPLPKGALLRPLESDGLRSFAIILSASA